MVIFRYSESHYFVKGFFNKSIYKGLLNLGAWYDKGLFYIPADVIEEVCCMLPGINVVDKDLWKHIFVGASIKECHQKATLAITDSAGNLIYLLNDEIAPELTNIKKIKYFNMNLLRVQQFNLEIKKSLYVEDYFKNTEIGLREHQSLFYSNHKTLDLSHVINRVCLSAT